MQISGITSGGPTSPIVEATSVTNRSSSTPTASSESHAASETLVNSSSVIAADPVEASSIQSTRAHNTVDSTQEGSPAAVFSASVAGKDYAAAVEKSGGEYFVALDSIPEVTATAANVMTAETRAELKLDTVV